MAKSKKDTELDPDANRVDAGDPNASDAKAVQDNDVVENAETGDVRVDHSAPDPDADEEPTQTGDRAEPSKFRRTATNAPAQGLHDPLNPQDGVQTEFEADRISVSHIDPPGVTRVKTVRMKGKGGEAVVNESDVEHYRARGYKEA